MHSNICPICRTQYMHIFMLYLQHKNAAESDLEPPAKRHKAE